MHGIPRRWEQPISFMQRCPCLSINHTLGPVTSRLRWGGLAPVIHAYNSRHGMAASSSGCPPLATLNHMKGQLRSRSRCWTSSTRLLVIGTLLVVNSCTKLAARHGEILGLGRPSLSTSNHRGRFYRSLTVLRLPALRPFLCRLFPVVSSYMHSFYFPARSLARMVTLPIFMV